MMMYNPSYCLRQMTVKVTFVYLSQNKAVLKPGGQLGGLFQVSSVLETPLQPLSEALCSGLDPQERHRPWKQKSESC